MLNQLPNQSFGCRFALNCSTDLYKINMQWHSFVGCLACYILCSTEAKDTSPLHLCPASVCSDYSRFLQLQMSRETREVVSPSPPSFICHPHRSLPRSLALVRNGRENESQVVGWMCPPRPLIRSIHDPSTHPSSEHAIQCEWLWARGGGMAI